MLCCRADLECSFRQVNQQPGSTVQYVVKCNLSDNIVVCRVAPQTQSQTGNKLVAVTFLSGACVCVDHL